MRKLLNKPWFAAVLALAAVAVVVHALLPKSEKGVSTRAAAEPVATAEETSGTEVAAGEMQGPVGDIRAALKELAISEVPRDPFSARAKAAQVVAVAVEKVAEPDLVDTIKLTAVWVQNGITYLLINERICQAGDRVGRLTIESATQDGVWVRHWKGRDFVEIGKNFTLTTPARTGESMAVSHDG